MAPHVFAHIEFVPIVAHEDDLELGILGPQRFVTSDQLRGELPARAAPCGGIVEGENANLFELLAGARFEFVAIEAHKLAPSMTPAAFAPYQTSDGQTSYELLSKSIEGLRNTASTVLDMACGDGHLFPYLLRTLGVTGTVVGVDMSEGELGVARTTFQKDERVKLHRASAQSLPLANNSVDAIVCHMAFMLMLPLDPVMAEISRVLKEGGIFSAVIGNARGKGGLFGDIQKLTSHFIGNLYPKLQEVRSGDPRVQSEAGLQELFSLNGGFQQPTEIKDFALLIKTGPQGVWDLMKDMYFVSMLPKSEKDQHEIEMKEFAASKERPDGTVSFEFQMRMFTAKKH